MSTIFALDFIDFLWFLLPLAAVMTPLILIGLVASYGGDPRK